MIKDMGEHVVAQITELLKANKAIIYGTDFPDNEYAEIKWSQYGLTETNEIAVMVKCGSRAFAARARSMLEIPVMADRVWGMDVSDRELAFKLADRLWASFSDQLLQEVKLIREKNK